MTPHSPQRTNNFNFLRLAFASLVLLSHAPELIDGDRSREILTRVFKTISFGEFAVNGFFLLSGYLIVQSWESKPEIFEFLKKRLLRIYPGFIVATIICVFVVGPLASNPATYFSAFWKGGFIKGLLLLQPPAVAPVFAHTHYALLNGSMWTISYEFCCYLLVVVFGLLRIIRYRMAWLGIVGLISVALVFEKSGMLTTPDPAFIRLAFYFLMGGLFFLFRERIKFCKKFAIALSLVLIGTMFSLNFVDLALGSVGAYLLFYLAMTPLSGLAFFNRLPDVSYGVYLYGWPVQKLFLWYFPTMSPWILFPVSLLVCVFFGAVSWYAVEKPMLKFKTRRVQLDPVPVSATL